MKTKIYAHRGASAYAPENTLEAFKLAAEMGADGVELDVQMTKDGQIVVIHDEKIDRTSNGSGFVKDYTLKELKEFDFSNNMEGFTSHIPTLLEVFEVLKPYDMDINIELKTGIFFYPIEEKVVALVEKNYDKNKILYSSFNHESVLKIKNYDKDAYLGFLYADGILDVVNYAKKYEVMALHPALYNIQYDGYLKECREKNIDINVWTVNEEKYMLMCLESGVTSIITNYPDVAINVREKYINVK